MMLDRAVINAGPLVALSLAGRLDLLPALFVRGARRAAQRHPLRRA